MIIIGTTKLHVNKPTYGREDWQKTSKQISIPAHNNSHQIRKVWRVVKHDQSYAQAVKSHSSTPKQSWKGISFDVVEADTKWLEGSHIGRVSDHLKVNEVKEEITQHGMGRLNVKYMGENAVLIQGITGTELGNLIEDNKEWWEANFESITP